MIGCFLQIGDSHCLTCHEDYKDKHNCSGISTASINCEKCKDWLFRGMNRNNYKYCPHCGKEL